MNRLPFSLLLSALLLVASVAQTPQRQRPDQGDLTVRIGTKLVQIDVAVTDKNDQVVRDLKLDNFELYEDGKKQQLQFIEFVDVPTGARIRDSRNPQASPAEGPTPITASGASPKRVIAFVVDDLTIPNDDMFTVRQMLQNFVDNQMVAGDLVAIVRSVGGRGLFEQFTSDRDLLRRAISTLTPRSHPFSTSGGPAPGRINPSDFAAAESGGAIIATVDNTAVDDTAQTLRAMMTLSTSSFVVDSMQELPGRKSMVLICGGLPILSSTSGTILGNVSQFFTELADQAARSGVVINTMDVRGLKSVRGVASFVDTPGKSSLGGSTGTGGFGRIPDPTISPVGPAEEHIGLRTLSNSTGGMAVLYTNNFEDGLSKVLRRNNGYYLLAYTPQNDVFDGKFRKLQVKVKRDGARVYTREGYFARESGGRQEPKTKEEALLFAAKSPLTARDINLSGNLLFKPTAANKSDVDIHLLVDAANLHFAQVDGKYQTSFDVAGFVYDQFGKLRGGFSQTINSNLSPESHQKAMATGISYDAHTQLPAGYYQLRVAVRENGSGGLGTLSRYMEIPDLSNGRLMMSSIFLYAADPSQSAKQPEPLLASRRLSRNQDLRYAALVYNPKLDKGKPQLRSQLIISQNGKELFKEPEQPIEAPNASAQIVKIGQLALAKVNPGVYTLTLVITDPQADKNWRTVARQVDFTVIE